MGKADVSPVKARRYRGVDAQERVAERRNQFIEAGLECFGTRGYHAVTVRELCAQAQLTERYFYESFKTREALFAAVYQDLVLRLRMDFLAAAAPESPSLEAMARAGLGVFFRLLKRDPRVARMLLVEVLTVSREMELLAQRATFGFGNLLRQLSVAALPARLAPPQQTPVQDLDLLATGLVGAAVHIAMRWTMDGCRQPVRTVIDTAMAIYRAVIGQIGTR
ncbi:MAG: TetR/AcrR family transcriptional regulator [Panacagrimonas sp.]